MNDIDFEEPTQLEFDFSMDGHPRQLDIIISKDEKRVAFVIQSKDLMVLTTQQLKFILDKGLEQFDFHYTKRGDGCH